MSSSPPQPSVAKTIKLELSEYTKSLIKTKANSTEPLCQEFHDTLNSDLLIANTIATFKTETGGVSQSDYVTALYSYFEASVTAYDPFLVLKQVPMATAFHKLTGKEQTSPNDFENSEIFPPDVETNLNRYLLMMYRNLGLLAKYQEIFDMKTNGSELTGLSGLLSNIQAYYRPELLKELSKKLSDAVAAAAETHVGDGDVTTTATTTAAEKKPLNIMYPIFSVYTIISIGIKDARTRYADPVFANRCDETVKCIEETAKEIGVQVPRRFSLVADQMLACLKFNVGDMKTAYKLAFKTALEAEKHGYPTIAYETLGLSALAISFGALGPTFTYRQALQMYDRQSTLVPQMKPFLPKRLYKSYSEPDSIQKNRHDTHMLDKVRPVHSVKDVIEGATLDQMPSDLLNILYECDVCGAKDYKMNKCGRCQGRYYCSGFCQTKDWGEGEHKKVCVAKK